MRQAAVILAAALTLWGNWPGVRGAWKGSFRPRMASWGPWTLAMGVGAAGAAFSRAWPSAAYTACCTAGCAAIVAVGWRVRQRGRTRRDVTCAALAVCGTILLADARADPALLAAWAAIAVAVAADAVAYWPTFGDGWRHPQGQPAMMYAAFAAAAALTLAAERQAAGLIYPAYLLAADGAMTVLVLAGRRRALAATPAAPPPDTVPMRIIHVDPGGWSSPPAARQHVDPDLLLAEMTSRREEAVRCGDPACRVCPPR